MQVSIITPFNFPLEIPVLQLMGALYMGNKPVLKVDSKVSSNASSFSACAYSFPFHMIYCHFFTQCESKGIRDFL